MSISLRAELFGLIINNIGILNDSSDCFPAEWGFRFLTK
jgi:hypothetical protein